VGGVYGGLKYAQYRVEKFITDQNTRMMEEMKKQRSFEKAQSHAANIVLPILRTYESVVATSVDIAGIKTQLKSKNCGDKVALWNQLKLAIFTKLCSSLLWVIVIVIVVKVQFNQVASDIFISNKSASSNVEDSDDIMDDVINQDHQIFLSLSQALILNNDTEKLTSNIERCVGDILQTMPLQCPVDASTIETTLHSIFHNFQNTFLDVDNKMMTELLQSCFPPSLFHDSYPNKAVQEWANTTFDILDSPDCESVFAECLHLGLDYLKTELHLLMDANRPEAVSNSPLRGDTATIPLAKSLPLINSLSEEVFSDKFINHLLTGPSLHEFSANVFDSFLLKF